MPTLSALQSRNNTFEAIPLHPPVFFFTHNDSPKSFYGLFRRQFSSGKVRTVHFVNSVPPRLFQQIRQSDLRIVQ
jgi:hypothetical protein